MAKIVILDAETIGSNEELSCFSSLGELVVYGATAHSERIEKIADADVVITNKVLIDKDIMDACPNLGLVAVTATGINNVDLDYAAKKSICVKNVAGYSTESVAQHTFASLFYLMSSLRQLDEFVASGEYAKHPHFTNIQIPVEQIYGLKYGIIGMGAIGKRVAEIASCFGAKVSYYSTSGKNTDAGFPNVSLDELLTESDIISIHAPLNEATENLIAKKQLAMMKPSAYLVNMGRGKIVNEADLAEALNNNTLKAAALDVLENEPINADNPLLELCVTKKLFIGPHVAWAGNLSRKKLIELVLENVRVFLATGA